MNGHTEEQAMRTLYPQTLPSADWDKCQAAECMAWRWIPLEADAAFLAAVAKRVKVENPETGKPYHHTQAAKYVTENRAEFGLPTKPLLGYCGLAGKP